MNYGHPNQGPPPAYNTHFEDEPLFTSPPEDMDSSMRRPSYNHTTSTFGAPPMGEPSEPSAHPDNKTAATQTVGAVPVAAAAPVHMDEPYVAGLNRQSSGSYEGSHMGLPQQSYTGHNAPTRIDTDHGTTHTSTSHTNQYQAPPQQSTPGAVPVGTQPGSPYVQTQSVPAGGTSQMSMIKENFNKYMAKAENIAGNIWSHMKTGPSVADTARGRMSQGIKLIQEGGFEGVYKSTFGMEAGEQLRKTYACYLSTSTGPVAGTLYISNSKFSFCSDRPLAYAPTTGQQAWSYYKLVVPLDKMKEVIPSFNEDRPQERYIQLTTQDGHDFWFMGFVNYEKAVMNMQSAPRYIGVIDPNGGLKAPWAGISIPGMKKTGVHSSPPRGPSHNPSTGGTANHYPNAPNPYTSHH